MSADAPVLLLEETGVKVTSTHVFTSSHTFSFRDIKRIIVKRAQATGLRSMLRPTYRILVKAFKTETPIFQTVDKKLLDRILEALARASAVHTDNKQLVQNK